MARVLVVAALIVSALMPVLAHADDESSIDRLRSKLDKVQAELDGATERVEALRTDENDLRFAVGRISEELRSLETKRDRLQQRAVSAARRLYMFGGSDMLEVLLSSASLAEIARRNQDLSHVSEIDMEALEELDAAEERMVALKSQLVAKADALTATRARLEEESARLQKRFDEVSRAYTTLKRKLAAAEARRAKAVAGGIAFITPGGMTCPIAAPNSFIDSWGFPRDGGARTHEGTDVMAAMGSPVVAVIDGRITYSGVGVTAGNWLELTGDDGNVYWYMHNQRNMVTSGRVHVGQQIATVGDTGNAAGGPSHVHFEYHPGGGGPIDPYPLLVKICRT